MSNLMDTLLCISVKMHKIFTLTINVHKNKKERKQIKQLGFVFLFHANIILIDWMKYEIRRKKINKMCAENQN